MREALRFTGKLISATVSRVADRWGLSASPSLPTLSPCILQKTKAQLGEI